MIRYPLAFAALAAVAASQAQPLDLKGRVVRAGGIPVAGAVVELKAKGVTVPSSADGTFILNGSSSAIAPRSERGFGYRLLPGYVSIESRIPLALGMEIFDMSGRRLGGVSRGLEQGAHRIPLAEAFAAGIPRPGLYALKLHLGGQSHAHRFFHNGTDPFRTGTAGSTDAARAKRAAGIDTLLVRKPGFKDFALEIASYTAGDLGDLTLTGESAPAFAVLADANRDGTVDAADGAGSADWAWKGSGAFFIANMDDDDGDGKADAGDQAVNGAQDEKDLAPIRIRIPQELLARAKSVSATAVSGSGKFRLFEKAASGLRLVNGTLSQIAAETDLGIEAVQFAGSGWDGFAVIRFDVADAQAAVIATQHVKMRVAPWIMLPNSAKTELLYISSTTQRMRPGIDAVLTAKGLPPAKASNPGGGQDVWFQDTMEMGYTQIPGRAPMHVVMNAVRGNAADNLAPTLLAPDLGLITVATTRNLGGGDHWMDWMGNLEVSHPVPGHPLGRIYHGKSAATTFHPDIVAFLNAQEVQKPFAIDTEWLFIQHVDEILNFVPDRDGKGKMIIVSPAAANAIQPAGYNAANQQIQGILDGITRVAKEEFGIGDADIITLPTYFSGGGKDFAPIWSSPVNSVHVNGTVIAGNDEVPAAIKTEVERKLKAIGLEVAWVDDGEYHPGGGNVHCGTNTKKTPVCPDFTDCL